MSSAQALVTRAYRRLGAIDINEQPSAAEMTHGLDVMSEMVNGWQSEGISTQTFTRAGDLVDGEKTVKGLDTTEDSDPSFPIQRGLNVSGTGVSANTVVADVLNATSFVMDSEAIADGADTELTFAFLPMPAALEGALVALLAVRLSEDTGKPVTAKLQMDADRGWNNILASYLPDRRPAMDPALGPMGGLYSTATGVVQ